MGGVDPIRGRKEGKLDREEERERPIPDTRVNQYSGAIVRTRTRTRARTRARTTTRKKGGRMGTWRGR